MNLLCFLVCILCLPALTKLIENYFSKDILHKSVQPRDLYDVEGFLSSYGYPFENHEVTTEDGYVLTVHRIPYGRNETNTNTTRPPVLVMHGILCSSINFMFLGPEKSIVLMLADAGYDVWAGNNRGNTWSRKHVYLNPDSDDQFWNYSFHEMGYYDDPAMIDYILNTTDNEKLFYVGHSQGTTQFFTMASIRPDYNEKILLMSALSPVVHCKHLTQPGIRFLASNYYLFDKITTLLDIREVGPHSDVITSLCQQTIFIDICRLFIFALMGYNPPQLARETVPQFYENFPEGTSMKDFKHLVQGTTYGEYSQYNYGTEENLIIYGRSDPPAYNVSLVSSPIAIYYSQHDLFSAVEDVDQLTQELPNLARKYLVEDEYFSHGDFMYATDINDLVNSEVVKFIKEFSTDE